MTNPKQFFVAQELIKILNYSFAELRVTLFQTLII